MSQKSIYDAINEVHRKINEQRMKNSENNHNAINEKNYSNMTPAEKADYMKQASEKGAQQRNAASEPFFKLNSTMPQRTYSGTSSSPEARKSNPGAGFYRTGENDPEPGYSGKAGEVLSKKLAGDTKAGERPITAMQQAALNQRNQSPGAQAALAAPTTKPAAVAPTTPTAPAAPAGSSGATMPKTVPGSGATATGFGLTGPTSSQGAVASVPKPAAPKPATPAAPRPAAAAPKAADVDTASIYKKHGVGGGDEDAGAFHRAEAEIAAARKTAASPAPTAASVKPTVPPPTVKPAPQARSAPAPTVVAKDLSSAPSSPAGASAGNAAAKISSGTGPDGEQLPPKAPADAPKAPTSETESGPKDKKKMSESTLISATLSLIGKENMFEAAKKMKGGCSKCGKTPCQCSGDPKKMEEEALDEKLVGNQKKLDKNHNNKLDSQDFKMLRGKKMEEEKKAKPDYLDMDKDGNKKESMKKAIKDKKIKDYRADRDKHGEMEEETDPGFSEAELAHFASVLESVKEPPMNALDPTVIDEEGEAAKRGRGRPPGKVGAYKRKGMDDSEAAQEPRDHILTQIRHAKEDEHGFKEISHPVSGEKKSIHRSELHGLYDRYHNKEKPREKEQELADFGEKHWGNREMSKATTKSVETTDKKIDNANASTAANRAKVTLAKSAK